MAVADEGIIFDFLRHAVGSEQNEMPSRRPCIQFASYTIEELLDAPIGDFLLQPEV